MTEHVEIVLVLNDGEFIFFEKVRKPLVKIFLAEALEVHEDHARIEKHGGIEAVHFGDVFFIHLKAVHAFAGRAADQVVAQIVRIKRADIPQNHRIAVEIKRLVVLRKHPRDKNAEIRGAGVIVAHVQERRYLLKPLADIYKGDLETLFGKAHDLFVIVFADARMKDIHFIKIVFRRVFL